MFLKQLVYEALCLRAWISGPGDVGDKRGLAPADAFVFEEDLTPNVNGTVIEAEIEQMYL